MPTHWECVECVRSVSGVCQAFPDLDLVHLRQHLKINFRHAFFSSENVMSVLEVACSLISTLLSVSFESSFLDFLDFLVVVMPFNKVQKKRAVYKAGLSLVCPHNDLYP